MVRFKLGARPARLLARCVLSLVVIASLSVGAGADELSFRYGNEGTTWQIQGSPISVLLVYSYDTSTSNYLNTVTPVWTNDCITFSNTSMRTVASVQFIFQVIDQNDNAVSAPLPFNVRETFAPGAVRNELGAYCKTYGYSAGKGQRLVGWVNEATYADGSTWHVVPAVRASVTPQPPSGVQILAATAYFPAKECVDFKNDSTRAIRHVQFVFSHSDEQGRLLGSDPLDVRVDVNPGSTSTSNCREFRGDSKPGVLFYARERSQRVPDLKPPTIQFAGVPSNLSIYVNHIDFTDGSTWDASTR